MVLILRLNAFGIKPLLLFAFFWATEALLIWFAWQNLSAPQTNFLAAMLLLVFWTVVSIAMTLKLYKNVIVLKHSRQV